MTNERKNELMNTTGIFFGPEKGSVGKVAQIIADELKNADLAPIKKCEVTALEKYDKLIFGISTLGRTNWDSEHEDDDWDVFFTQLSKVDWSNKKVAIYGLGDQINYPDHFVDAIGWLYEKLKDLKVTVVGLVDNEGYQFNDSEGLLNGKFAGLPLDEDNEPELTLPRVKKWLSDIKKHGF